MKAVLISIKPKWCELIASGEKTVEVRKTRPKLDTPFKCYIYCTKDPKIQFWKSKFYSYADDRSHNLFDKSCNGKVIGEFVCDEMREYYPLDPKDNINKPYGNEIEKDSCLTSQQVNDYAIGRFGYGKLYGWHISNLVIYDKPKELSEFSAICKYKNDDDTCQTEKVACPYQQCDFNQDGSINLVECGKKIARAPQSWCYVEELSCCEVTGTKKKQVGNRSQECGCCWYANLTKQKKGEI